jgi:hypothetical protein
LPTSNAPKNDPGNRLLAGGALVVRLADEAEPPIHHGHGGVLGKHAGDGEPARRAGVPRRDEHGGGRTCRRCSARAEDEGQLAPRFVPNRDRRIGEERSRVGRERAAEQCRAAAGTSFRRGKIPSASQPASAVVAAPAAARIHETSRRGRR